MQEIPAGRVADTKAHPSAKASGSSSRSMKDRLLHEATRFGLMFVYLWLVFGLFVLFEQINRGQMGLGYQSQSFAVINALVLAKVMLVAEDLKLDRGTRAQPIAVAALAEAFLFAIVFIGFHVLERLVVGLLQDQPLRPACQSLVAAAFAGLVTVAAIMSVVLIPYFAFRDIGRALGPGKLRKLLFSQLASAGT